MVMDLEEIRAEVDRVLGEREVAPPMLLGVMRLVGGEHRPKNLLERKMRELFDKDFEKFFDRWQKLELAYQEQLKMREERLRKERKKEEVDAEDAEDLEGMLRELLDEMA